MENKIDTQEILDNLEIICKNTKFTYEEHEYLQKGLAEVRKQLIELKAIKAPKEETPKKD